MRVFCFVAIICPILTVSLLIEALIKLKKILSNLIDTFFIHTSF